MQYSFAILLALLSVLQSQTPSTTASYDFKGDQLGMDLHVFQDKHVKPDSMTCKLAGKDLTTCGFRNTVGGTGANIGTLFVGDKLAMISVSFDYEESQLQTVQRGLTDKLGPPEDSLTGNAGPVTRWTNGSSVAVLYAHDCENNRALVNGPLVKLTWDIQYALDKKHYCGHEDGLSYHFSRIVFVDTALGVLAQTRIREAFEEAGRKARKDM